MSMKPQRTAEDIDADMDAAIDRLRAIPPGYLYSILWIGFTKYMLARVPMEQSEQLDWLKKLNAAGKGDLRLTAAVVAAVPALSDPAARIVHEAMRLDPEESERREIGDRIVEISPGRNSFNLLTSCEGFSTLVRMNPGMLDACEMLYSPAALQ